MYHTGVLCAVNLGLNMSNTLWLGDKAYSIGKLVHGVLIKELLAYSFDLDGTVTLMMMSM